MICLLFFNLLHQCTITFSEDRTSNSVLIIMRLVLSDDSPLSTIITDSYGQDLYRVQSSYTCGPQKTNIYRSRDTPPSYYSTTKDSQSVRSDDKTLANERDNEFSVLASIEWHTFASSRLIYQGKEVELQEFMPNEKSFARGRRVLTGPDGRTYRWNHPVLELNDGSKTPAAIYKRSRRRKGEPATIEILPDGEHMLDLIVITWVYVERIIRKQRTMRRMALFGPGTAMLMAAHDC